MGSEEVYFPRGGSLEHGKNLPNNRHLVFDHVVKKRKKTKQKKVERHHAVTGPQPKLVAVEDLSYKVMTEGMLVLGRVKEIHDHFVDVVLPGLTEGRVPITHISEPYTQLLKSSSQGTGSDEDLCPLSKMFFKGQLVTAQISNILQSDYGKHEIALNLNPSALHSEWSHTSMALKGLIITAAVRSIEEHGYVMDCGVASLRCFLHVKNAKRYCDTFHGGQSLAVGQLLRCLVTEAESNSNASKIQVTADPAAIAKQEQKAALSVTVQQLLPGMCFELSVLQELKGGIKTKIINLHGVEGFVHRNQIPMTFENKNICEVDVSLGSKNLGRLLYVTPLIKTPYFSLLPSVTKALTDIPKPSPIEQLLKVGSIINHAEVCEVYGKGIVLHLKKHKCHAKGFVPLRRSSFNLKRAEEENSKSSLELIRNEFPIGSNVKCRILHYDSISEVFICSMEKHVLDEKYLTLSDINVGDVVSCVVQELKNGGIVVQVGKLIGFVPASHSADIPLQHPEQKFQPGLEVKGRVMKIDMDKHRMIITFKQSLVLCDTIITSYSDPKIGHRYLGAVVAVVPKGVFVSFFGGVRGFLPYGPASVPEGQKFFEGQLLKCFVVRKYEKQIYLSLLSDLQLKSDVKPSPQILEESNKKPVKKLVGVEVGHKYSVKIVSIDKSGLYVRVISKKIDNEKGFIPVLHLCDDTRLASLLCDTYKTGTTLENVWCYRSAVDDTPAIFSLRATVQAFFESVQGQLLRKKSFESVCKGWIIPCSVQKIDSDYVLLEVPVPQFSGLVRVDKENICNGTNDKVDGLGLVVGQGIQGKVLSINYKMGLLSIGCSLKHVWDGELESCVSHLLGYLKDQHRLLQHMHRSKDPLGSYSIGSEVKGIVKERKEWGFVIELDDGVRGEATFFNAMSADLEIGTVVSGVVLYVDCLRRHVEINLSSDIRSFFCEKAFDVNSPKIEPPIRLRGPTLLVTPEFILVQVKWAGKRGLSFVPTQLYPFMSSPLSISEPFFGLDRKLICKSVWNEFLVSLPMEVVVNKERRDKLKAKRKEKLEKRNEMKFSITSTGEKLLAPEEIKKEDEDTDSDSDDPSNPLDVHESDDECNGRIVPQTLTSKRKNSQASANPNVPSKKVRVNPVMMLNSSENHSESEAEKSSDELQLIEIVPSKRRKLANPNVDNSKVECLNLDEAQEFSSKKKNKQVVAENSSNQSVHFGDVDSVLVDDTQIHSTDNTLGSQDTNGLLETSKNALRESSGPKLKSPGFVWDVDPKKFLEAISSDKGASSSDDDGETSDSQNSKKKNRKRSGAERREAAKIEEERLQKIEHELMDPNRKPTSCDDFDRMVLSDPNNSSVWLQYMAFYMQATEIEKARAVAQRAIKTINYREEQEKLNVWLGLLNLENLYGTPNSLSSTLQEALQYNDPFKVRSHMIRIYAESGKCQELDNEVKLVTKKFKDVPGMWLEVISILMDNGQAERARKILDISLPHLKNKQDSTALVVQFALMEARHNNLERAKGLLESLLASYPQRVDVWCTYCDLLVKANLIEEARQLLERCVNLKLQARKMKTLFAKFLKFEESHGTLESQNRVRKLAVDYVNQVTGGTDSAD